jgi:hypothetical protein
MSTADAAAHFRALPLSRRPDTVVVGVPGYAWEANRWTSTKPQRRLLGSHDSGLSSGSSFTWRGGTSGTTAGRLILARLGELTRYGGAWGGTSDAWLKRDSTTQCAKAAAAPNGVLVLGDSITSRDYDGIRNYLNSHGLVSCVFAQGSGRITDLVRRAREQRVPLPKTVIVALGNNDVFSAARVRNDIWLTQNWLGPDRNLVWLTIWRTRAGTYLPEQQYNARVINRLIWDLHSDRPNSTVIDWYAQCIRRPSLQYDGIHLTSSGLTLRYSMMTAAAKELIAAGG